MELTWYGHSCFRLMERGRITTITDPFADSLGLPAPKLKGDLVTISHDAPGHNALEAVKGTPRAIYGPGEYEIGNVFVVGAPMHDTISHPARANIAYLFDYDGLTVLHVGDLMHVPEQSVVESFGEVDVLLLPVGGGNGLKADEAAEVVALIEPRYVVPMHYAIPGINLVLEPVDRFLKAMGANKPVETDLLKFTAADRPEQTQVVILRPQA